MEFQADIICQHQTHSRGLEKSAQSYAAEILKQVLVEH